MSYRKQITPATLNGPPTLGFSNQPPGAIIRRWRRTPMVRTEPRNFGSAVATGVLANIHSADFEHPHELRALAQHLQTQRWKLIFNAADDLAHIDFATVVVSEQWVRANVFLLGTRPQMVQQLVRERLRLIETFLTQSLSPEEAFPHDEAGLVRQEQRA
jgi:hypothetical protein